MRCPATFSCNDNHGDIPLLKKTIALCALGLAASAHAQSSLTIFGGMDVGFSHGSGSVSNKNALTSGNNYTSRIGFKGNEDLGGGGYAGFYLEAQINGDDGTGVASNTNNQASGLGAAAAGRQGLVFHRGSYVNLGGNWGEVRLGRDYVGHYRNRTDFDPFTNVGVGWSQAQAGSIAGVTAVRASNEISYLTPAMGGFFGVANYYLGENLSNAVNKDDGSGYSTRVGYRAGPWFAAVAYGLTKYTTTASNGDTRVINAGISYVFPIARVMAGVYNDRVNSTTPLTAKGYLVGFTAPVGAHEIRGSYSRYGTDAAGSPTTNKLAVGYVYNLSKRSAVYGTYAHVNNKGGASASLNGSVTGANEGSSGFDVGIRHTF